MELVAPKIFREDFTYRLNVIDIRIHPLRERTEDVPLLFNHFLQRSAAARGIVPPAVAADVMKTLVASMPGNVRQLKNIAERLIARAEHPIITLADLPPELVGRLRTSSVVTAPPERPAIEIMFDRW